MARDNFITNMYNPFAEDAIKHIVKNEDEGKRRVIFNYMIDQIKKADIGLPRETERHSVEELTALNIVGLYRNENTPKSVVNFLSNNSEEKKALYEPENVLDINDAVESITITEVDNISPEY
jgi:hypothetical protein